MHIYNLLLRRAFHYLGSAHQVFILNFLYFALISALLVSPMYLYNVTSPQFWSSYLSMFSLFVIFLLFLSTTCLNYLSLSSLLVVAYVCHTGFSLVSSFLIFSILLILINHLNILMSVLSSKSCLAFLGVKVSLPQLV